MVVFDNTYLTLLLNPAAPTKLPVPDARDRIEFLLETLERSRERILIPSPVVGEVLVLAGRGGPDILAELTSSSRFQIADFDLRAAIEFAASVAQAIASGDKRRGSGGSWAKAKFDQQIVAVAKVHSVGTIYSDDVDIVKLCEGSSIRVTRIADLTQRPTEAQPELEFPTQ
jgi:hypothetical protein